MKNQSNIFSKSNFGFVMALLTSGCAANFPSDRSHVSSEQVFRESRTCAYQNDSRGEKVCISNQAGLAEETMATYLQAARSTVEGSDSLTQQIDDSQKAWIRYRKEQCDDDSLWAKVGGKPFSFRLSMECQLDLTRSRTHDIWAVYLSHNPKSPILSEPYPPKISN